MVLVISTEEFVCSKCNRSLSIKNFPFLRKHGFRWICRECRNVYEKERNYLEKKQVSRKQSNQKWYVNNRDYFREYYKVGKVLENDCKGHQPGTLFNYRKVFTRKELKVLSNIKKRKKEEPYDSLPTWD